jgi:hypothetical protein
MLPPAEAALNYFALTIVYYALSFPILSGIFLHKGNHSFLIWVGLIVVGPMFFGCAAGCDARFGWSRRTLSRLGINLVHVMPTAWDWKFSDAAPQWVLVTLKDGKRFAGFFGGASFASSDQAERDIYIQKIYDIGDENKWIDCGEKSALIMPGEVQTVEFFPDRKEQSDANQ